MEGRSSFPTYFLTDSMEFMVSSALSAISRAAFSWKNRYMTPVMTGSVMIKMTNRIRVNRFAIDILLSISSSCGPSVSGTAALR